MKSMLDAPVDNWHVKSRSLTTGNFNIRLFFSPFVIFFYKCNAARQNKIYDLGFQF